MIVAIAGATGLTGHLCLLKLLQHPQVTQVVAIGRGSTGLQAGRLREIQLVNNQLMQSVRADAFVCCLGTTLKKAGSPAAFRAVDLELPVYLARQLHAEGCGAAAIISALGANASSSVLYTRTKGEMEQAMQAIGFRSLSFLRPSLIDGPRVEKRVGERLALLALWLLGPLLIGPLARYRAVKAEAVAEALLSSIITHLPGHSVYQHDGIEELAGA
jgi:uncharacterized protein YbjT (DUF2867 family)